MTSSYIQKVILVQKKTYGQIFIMHSGANAKNAASFRHGSSICSFIHTVSASIRNNQSKRRGGKWQNDLGNTDLSP